MKILAAVAIATNGSPAPAPTITSPDTAIRVTTVTEAAVPSVKSNDEIVRVATPRQSEWDIDFSQIGPAATVPKPSGFVRRERALRPILNSSAQEVSAGVALDSHNNWGPLRSVTVDTFTPFGEAGVGEPNWRIQASIQGNIGDLNYEWHPTITGTPNIPNETAYVDGAISLGYKVATVSEGDLSARIDFPTRGFIGNDLDVKEPRFTISFRKELKDGEFLGFF